MSFITQFFIKPGKPVLLQVPSGSFTVNRNGQVMSCTLPQTFPAAQIQTIGHHVLAAFRAAEQAQIALTELVVNYPALKLVARETRSTVIVFLQI